MTKHDYQAALDVVNREIMRSVFTQKTHDAIRHALKLAALASRAASPQPDDLVERVASKLWHSTPSHYDMSWSELVALSKDNLSLMATVSEFLAMAKAAIAAMQPAIDKARAEAKAEERARCPYTQVIVGWGAKPDPDKRYVPALVLMDEADTYGVFRQAIEKEGGDASV